LRIQNVLDSPFFKIKEQAMYSLFLDYSYKRIKFILFWAYPGIKEYVGCSQKSGLPK